MTKKEHNDMLDCLKETRKRIQSEPGYAEEFLIGLGILSKKEIRKLKIKKLNENKKG